MENNDKIEFEKKIDTHYSYFGKIAVEFERMCSFLRMDILFFLQGHGLKEQDLSRIMLADLSAYQLITKFRAIYAFTYKDKPEYIKHLDPFFKAMLKINEKRNFIIHGNWSIPEVNEHNMNKDPELDKVLAHKEIVKKDGLHLVAELYGEDDYTTLISKIKESTRILHLVQGAYTFKRDLFSVIKDKDINKVI
ncbi:MAG: hypothetical protein V7719_16930 [Psychroserpens sp.]